MAERCYADMSYLYEYNGLKHTDVSCGHMLKTNMHRKKFYIESASDRFKFKIMREHTGKFN